MLNFVTGSVPVGRAFQIAAPAMTPAIRASTTGTVRRHSGCFGTLTAFDPGVLAASWSMFSISSRTSVASLRRFFEVDAECITVAALYQLAQRGEVKPAQIEAALRELDVDPEKVNPMHA